MRIALFTETFLPHTDGIVTRLTRTIEELRAAGDEVLVVAPATRGLPAAYAGAHVVGVPSVALPFYRGIRLGFPVLSGLSATLAEFAPDILHAANPVTLGLAAYAFAGRSNAPLVASYHTHLALYAHRYALGGLERAAWAYLRALHNRAGLTLCTSRPTLELLEQRGFERLALWAPGVDTRLFTPEQPAGLAGAWRARLSPGRPEATLLLYVGRLAREKGLERVRDVLPSLPGCHLALIGTGPAEAELRQAFAGLSVTFVGPLYGAELAAAYAAADLFVFPSITETLGLVAIEAMASGLPVVAARRGGLPDIVAEGATGLLFEPDVPGDLVRAVGALVADPALRRRQGHAARRRAEGWSWAAATAGLRAQYQALLDAQAARTVGAVPEASEAATSA